MKSHTSGSSTVSINRNTCNSTVQITSNKISLENIICEKLPEKLKGKIIETLTVKETNKKYNNVCAGSIWWSYGAYLKLPTTNCCSSSKICGNCHIDPRFDGYQGFCGEQMKTGKCKNKYCKRVHILEIEAINYTSIIAKNTTTSSATASSATASTSASATIINFRFDFLSTKEFPKLSIKEYTKKQSLNNVWDESFQILKIIKVLIQKKPVIIKKENPVIIKEENPVIIKEENPVIIKEENPVITEEKNPVITKVKLIITNEQPFSVKVKLSFNNINSLIIIDDDGFILVQRNRKFKTSRPTSPVSIISNLKPTPLDFQPNILQKMRNDFNKSPTSEKIKSNISKKVLKNKNKKEKELKNKKEEELKIKKEEELKIKKEEELKIKKEEELQTKIFDNSDEYDEESDDLYDSDDSDYDTKFWSKK